MLYKALPMRHFFDKRHGQWQIRAKTGAIKVDWDSESGMELPGSSSPASLTRDSEDGAREVYGGMSSTLGSS
jgi:hypothetical protein